MKTLLFLMILAIPNQLAMAEIVYYKDDEGNLHAADSPDLIPAKYRKKLKTINSGTDTPRGSSLTKESFKYEVSGGRNVILVDVGGTEIYMSIEPDAESSIIPPSLVNKLGLRIVGNAEAASAPNGNGKERNNVMLTTVVPKIGIKQFQVSNMQVYISELKNYGRAEGILAGDYFKNFRVMTEMENKSITLERK